MFCDPKQNPETEDQNIYNRTFKGKITIAPFTFYQLTSFLYQQLVCFSVQHLYHYIWNLISTNFSAKDYISAKNIRPELHLLKVLFETNLVGKISTKVPKKALYSMYSMPNIQLIHEKSSPVSGNL